MHEFIRLALLPHSRLIRSCHILQGDVTLISISTLLVRGDHLYCRPTPQSRAEAIIRAVSTRFEWMVQSILFHPPFRKIYGSRSAVDLVVKLFRKSSWRTVSALVFHFSENVTCTNRWWHRVISTLYTSPNNVTEKQIISGILFAQIHLLGQLGSPSRC